MHVYYDYMIMINVLLYHKCYTMSEVLYSDSQATSPLEHLT